jgi:hypothetical protein
MNTLPFSALVSENPILLYKKILLSALIAFQRTIRIISDVSQYNEGQCF